MHRWLLGAAVVLSAQSANALGTLVSTADGGITNDVSQAILLHDGTRAVLTIANTYVGPRADFAMIVPVPASVGPDDVKSPPGHVFQKLEMLTSPRIVEYWEQDPCAASTAAAKTTGPMKIDARLEVRATPLQVAVDATFEAGPYEVTFVEATSGADLETWLAKNKYRVPVGTRTTFEPYIRDKQKFLVARLAWDKLKKPGAMVALPLLRVVLPAKDVGIPVRIGVLNAGPRHDFTLYVVGRDRYEAANYPNAVVPTNLEVTPETRSAPASFYATLFDATAGKGMTWVTEYAWSPHSCQYCTVALATLDPDDIAAIGGDALFAEKDQRGARLQASSILAENPKIGDGINAMIAANRRHLSGCAEQAFRADKAVDGDVAIELTMDAKGRPTAVTTKVTSGKVPGPGVSCLDSTLKSFEFAPIAGTATLNLHIDSAPGLRIPSLTLTRLHARYGGHGVKDDLALRTAAPIRGGQEEIRPDGSLETGVSTGETSSFLARYAVRHAWTGSISCASPKRGVWRGTPDGNPPQISSAIGISMVPRPGPSLASVVLKGLTNVAALDQVAAANAISLVPPAASAAPSSAPSAAPSSTSSAPAPSAAPSKRSCHCSAPGADRSGALWPLLGLVVAVARRARR